MKDKEKKCQDLWNVIFEKKYEETTKYEIHTFVDKLIERFYLFRKSSPQSLGILLKNVLAHPNISKLDKEVYFFYLKII